MLDGLTSLQMATGLVHVIAIGRPKGCQCLGISLVERRHESFGDLPKGYLFLGIALSLRGQPRLGKAMDYERC